jgi:hypothetical protein
LGEGYPQRPFSSDGRRLSDDYLPKKLFDSDLVKL